MRKHDIFIFDFDGTLADTKESLVPVYRAGFDLLGMKVSEAQCAHFMHHNLLETMQEMNVDPSDYERFVLKVVEALDYEESLSLIKPFPETEKVLQKLEKERKTLIVVSGNSSVHIKKVLEKFRWSHYFKLIVGSDMYKHGKPSPEPLLLGLSLLGDPDKSKAVYIGDSKQDRLSAIAAGIDWVLVDRDGSYGNETRTIRSLDEAEELA